MHLNGTTAGLWLVGVGAFLAALPRLVRAPRPELGLPWETLAERVERLHYAVETVGLLLVAAGSVVLAAVELGPWWFVLGVVLVAVLAVWLLAAVKLRQLWQMRATHARDYGVSDPPIAGESEQRAVALAHARWSACLRQAFAPTAGWPPAPTLPAPVVGSTPGRLEPRHIAELHEADGRLAELHVPPAVANDVELIRAQGFDIDIVGDAIIATAPGGRGSAQVSRSGVAANSSVTVLHRQRWLDELKDLGLDVRPGTRGQPHVAGSIEWRLPDPPAA
jgi:hypothetical protein